MCDAAQQTTGDAEYTIQNQKPEENVFGVSLIQVNDKATILYTGLSSYKMFVHLFLFFSPWMTATRSLSLEKWAFPNIGQASFEPIPGRFGYTIFKVDLKEMVGCREWSFLLAWPQREVSTSNMPSLFKELYPKCRVIIDCSEVFIETLSYFEARSKRYSNYKKHNTSKFLLGIAPCRSKSLFIAMLGWKGIWQDIDPAKWFAEVIGARWCCTCWQRFYYWRRCCLWSKVRNTTIHMW